MTGPTLSFDECSRLPADGDNVAIATRRLERGTAIVHGERRFAVAHTVLEGHRFVFAPIAAGQPLLSWGLPFGDALRDLVPGEYICNERILRALAARDVDFELPAAANFADRFARCELDPAAIVPGRQVAPVAVPGTFLGFRRPGARGVGTRNFLVVIGLTSADAALASAIAERCRQVLGTDDIVAVTHTEGGGRSRPHNLEFVLRTLAGFVVHPNTGAALVVDHGAGAYSGADLQEFLRRGDYAPDDVPHEFLQVDGTFAAALQAGEASVARLWPQVAACRRTEAPLAALRLALQCGGSDAFSGVSGNSLAGWVAKELIRHGGGANLAETDELIGAEPYVLANVRSGEVAARFLAKVEAFKALAERHGASAEGNPSGGNNYRGLYNIALKSLGAARKKDPEVRLDEVLDYGAPMTAGGYYFMDSPGNDLESIAGQVASGCNLILFITGNGSITNFPFVPTLKFVTTTGRYELLSGEMDVNAGRYNDGMPMDELGAETFELVRRVASGERTKGERAGHSQVSIWREWRQADDSQLDRLRAAAAPQAAPQGRPLAVAAGEPLPVAFEAFPTGDGVATDRIGLVMPTSLCSGQVAELIADHMNRRGALPGGLSRIVALAHTEGCGAANADELYLQTLLGHLRHPFTQRALLLEHGCEKTHNDAVRHWLAAHGQGTERYGFASVQLDGGIDRVRDRVVAWFDAALRDSPAPARVSVDTAALRLAVLSHGLAGSGAVGALAALCRGVVHAGGLVVLAENDALLQDPACRRALLAGPDDWRPTLAYGQFAATAGLHVMQAPTEDPSETVTGLGGTGVEVMLAAVADRALQAHPMIPLLQVAADAADAAVQQRHAGDLDLVLAAGADPLASARALLARIAETASGRYRPRLSGVGNVRFQLTRGHLGVSL